MPVTRCKKSGKWKIGAGPARYDTKEKAERAQKAMYAQKNKK